LDLGGMLETLRVTGASGLDLQAERGRMTKANVDQLRAGGYELHCWTVNDEALAREYQALGVESITTDRPAVMRKLLSDRGTSSAAAAKP
jgi:glycerophosphoryl diester phosphodiesterase